MSPNQSMPGQAHLPMIGRFGLLVMAAAAGVAVANIYYNQPMLGVIEAELGQPELIGLVPTAAQLGYALGLLLVLPLGDILSRRKLITVQLAGLGLLSALAALAPNAWLLLAASFLLGLGASVAQQIIPFATLLVPQNRRGSALGTVMAGLLSGILLSRVLSGFVSAHLGWRDMFWLAVPLAFGGAAAMFALLPEHAPSAAMRYGAAMRSLVHLWRREPVLRRATLLQAILFGTFTAFWTILAFHLQQPYFGLGADIAGLFGILGVAGVLAAPLVGWVGDRRGPGLAIWLGIGLTLAAWVVFGLWNTILGLALGVILLDLGVQGVLVSNQHIIYALDHSARSRLNTIFMTGMFLGGALGSAGASFAWTHFGWSGVAVLGVGLSLLGVVCQLATRMGRKPAAGGAGGASNP